MNELHLQTSPYLLQHASNPVHWKPWNEKTLERAVSENKLILVSIGYSTCHWCHVMEHESFENPQVAQLMNNHFINIKVDREELPQVDNYYIKAVQIMTKKAGWPLNVVCLPNGHPIWGGTYFPRQQWMDYLNQLQELYAKDPEKVEEFAQKLQQGISAISSGPFLDPKTRFNLDLLMDKWAKSFDWEFGGYAIAPKFMMPNNLLYLQKNAVRNNNTTLLSYVDLSLRSMAWGGIFDPIEGGFCRYSVDHKWHIPHFEKMLYDNAQLLSLYADAYKRTQDPLYKQVIEKTIKFVSNTFSNAQGGYYSALDADSLNSSKQLQEGAYYVWSKQELKDILKDDFSLFSTIFNINEYGYWEEDNYVLIQNQPLDDIAKQYSISLEALEQKKAAMEELLLTHRSKRAKPFLDNKSLASWNALYIVGLLDAYTALNQKQYLDKAVAVFDFIYTKMHCSEKGLYRSYTNSQKGPLAFMDDYAFFIQASIYLYKHTGQSQYLEIAKHATDYSLDHFWDTTSGFFFYSQNKQEEILNSIETEDNVIVSCNSTMGHNLYQLGILFQNSHYSKIAHNMLEVILTQVDYPSAFSNWLLLHLYKNNPNELVLVGEDALKLSLELRKKILTTTLVFPVVQDCSIPYLNKPKTNQELTVYFCTDNTCLPASDNLGFVKQHTL
ncbi:thioredoxin domain-containing protein [Myroides sp. LJL116]